MSDFERTFGAGADAVSIIDGFTRIYKEKYNYVDTKCLIFNLYDDALDFLKLHPKSCLTRAGDRKGFKVTPPDGEYFRVDSKNRNRYEIIYEYFVIKIPCSIEDEKNGRTRIAEMATKKEGAETDYDIVISYVRSCLCCSCSSLKSITRNPPSISDMICSLKSIDMQFEPISESICLIVKNYDSHSVEGALLTKDGFTEVICDCDDLIYNKLV